MALILKKIFQTLWWSQTELPDPRTDDYFIAGSLFSPLIIIGLYFYFVGWFGPKFMRKREPYNLEKFLVFYNAFQVIVCLYIAIEGSKIVLFKYDWRCAAVDYSYNKDAIKILNLTYLYYLVKIIDLFDTVFFILRKKEKQVTFLHTYHHFGMVFLSWVGVRYIAGGHSVYLGIINCFVHAVMYFYYLLTAYDKEYKKSIWWKKHITQLQLGQFITFFFLYGQLLFRKNCKYPLFTQIFFLPQVSIMTFLFADFYYKTYIKKPTPAKEMTKSTPNTNKYVNTMKSKDN